MGAGCEAQVKNNQQVSSRTSKRGHPHWTVRLGCTILANRLAPPSGPRISVGAANRGLGQSFVCFFEINIF